MDFQVKEQHYVNWCRANGLDPYKAETRERYSLLKYVLEGDAVKDLETILSEAHNNLNEGKPKQKAIWKWTYFPAYDTRHRHSKLQWLYIAIHVCLTPVLLVGAVIAVPVWLPLIFLRDMKRAKIAARNMKEADKKIKANYSSDTILKGNQPIPYATFLKLEKYAKERSYSGVWARRLLATLDSNRYVVDFDRFHECATRVPQKVWPEGVFWPSDAISREELWNHLDPEVGSKEANDQRVININLSVEVVDAVDQLKEQLGLRSRAAIVERLLEEQLFSLEDEEADDDLTPPPSQ